MGREGTNSYTWGVDEPIKPITKPVEEFGKEREGYDPKAIKRRAAEKVKWRQNPNRITEEQWARIRRNDSPENFVNDKRDYYRKEYLKSQHWAELRARKLKQSPVCEEIGCGSRKRVEPHHLRYKNLYDVELEDLKTLCRRCHRKRT